MELGLFLALMVLVGIGLARQSYLLLGLAIPAAFILAVYIASEDVTLEQHSEASAEVRDANNTLTKTGFAEKDDQINIFKENRHVMSYIFYALGLFASVLFFTKVIGGLGGIGGLAS